MMSRGRTRGEERGATAIIVAVAAVFLFSCGAMAVDLGNGFARKRDVQTQADFGALASAASMTVPLPSTVPTEHATDSAVKAAAKYLVDNRPLSEGDPPDPTLTYAQQIDQMADALVNGDPEDGEVQYLNKTEVRILSPYAHVAYGMGTVLGYNSVDVQGDATAGMFSPGSVMPVYAWSGCDYGPETMLTDSSATLTPIPALKYPGPPNNNGDVDELSPARVDLNPMTPPTLTISGSHLNTVSKVGFFRTGSPLPEPVIVTPTTHSSNSLTLTVPSTVTSVETAWYVRVWKDADANWSSVDPDKTEPLPVGAAPLECDADSSDGNYGTLDLPRDDYTAFDDQVAMNMATSPQFTLDKYPAGVDECTGEPSPYVHSPNEYTNCVDTKTGFPGLAATEGLITGIGSTPGRLDKDTTPACGSSRVDSGVNGKMINNDYLTCFFTDDTTTIEDISKPSYPAPADPTDAVISSDIFKSPRFVWQPVLHVEPDNGGSEQYTIIDFRPGFITDQPLWANGVNNTMDTATNNGIVADSSGLRAVKVILFNVNALPQKDGGGPVTPYLGSGPKFIRLID